MSIRAILTGCLRTTAFLATLFLGLAPLAPVTAMDGAAKCEWGETSLDDEERAMLKLINEYRAKNGKPQLEVSVALTCASEWMAADMAKKDYFNHKDSLGRDPFKRMSALGYDHKTSRGENIASGFRDAATTFELWKNSRGHNATMLKASYRVIGISRVQDAATKVWYWTTDFGGFKDALMAETREETK
ncbi:MAG: CAP domain-containing protein [Blastocatellia bacterium]|nr:CAP domain-containing protein [Blastocatellia bacterium]